MSSASCFNLFHSFFDGRLYEECTFFEFFKNTGTFVFLLKPLKGSIDIFVFVNVDTNHLNHLPY